MLNVQCSMHSNKFWACTNALYLSFSPYLSLAKFSCGQVTSDTLPQNKLVSLPYFTLFCSKCQANQNCMYDQRIAKFSFDFYLAFKVNLFYFEFIIAFPFYSTHNTTSYLLLLLLLLLILSNRHLHCSNFLFAIRKWSYARFFALGTYHCSLTVLIAWRRPTPFLHKQKASKVHSHYECYCELLIGQSRRWRQECAWLATNRFFARFSHCQVEWKNKQTSPFAVSPAAAAAAASTVVPKIFPGMIRKALWAETFLVSNSHFSLVCLAPRWGGGDDNN